MNTIKRFFVSAFDNKRAMNERLFVRMATLALDALLILAITGIFIGENKTDIIVLFASFLIYLPIYILSVRYNKIPTAANVTAILIIFVLLPLTFFLGGGIYGGAPLWFVFCTLFICLTTVGKVRIILLVSDILMACICYFTCFVNPDFIEEHSKSVAYLDSFISLIFVCSMIIYMVLYEISILNREMKISREQSKEIEALNKAQNRFFSSMSHEIRTPINTIIGLNEMILREDINDEVASDAKNIQSASKLLLSLVNDILDMSKIESGRMELVPVIYDIGDMLSELVGMMWIKASEKGLDFHVDIDPNVPSRLVGDEVRIKQVLINLLTNAIKYTKEGSVTLSIGYEESGVKKATIIYTVSDTGMGIKKESIPHLFSTFKRIDETKNRYIEGTGLGLSIVKEFVDLMNGEISVNSIYRQGSTFIVKIPHEIADKRAVGELNIETRHALNARRHYRQSFEAPDARLLAVDDNAANLLVVKKLLRDTKVQIDTADNAEQALKMTLEKVYNVIFMDHLMPGMDGIECMHRIREQVGGLNKNSSIVALTANAGSENKALYAKEGFDGYLLKPVSGTDLEDELIKQLPRELLKLNENFEEQEGEEVNLNEQRRRRIPVVITTESVCDLPHDISKMRDVDIIPFHVITAEGDFYDGIETESRGLLSYLSDIDNSVRSEAPGVEEYEQFFAGELIKANNIIHIALSDRLGQAYKRALKGAEAFDNVTVIDCGNLSSGMGLCVIEARRLLKEGKTPAEIKESIESFKKLVHTSFIVDDTEFLARAGKMSSRINKLSKAFLLHPVLEVKKGRLKAGRIIAGARKKVWERYISSEFKRARNIDKEVIFITYAGLKPDELEEISALVRKHAGPEKIICQKASSAISANCGPGTFGIIFRER